MKRLCFYLATKLEFMLLHGNRRLRDRSLRLQLLVLNCCLLLSVCLNLGLGLVFVFSAQYSMITNFSLPLLSFLGIIYLFSRQRFFLMARVLYVGLGLASVSFGVFLYGKQSQLLLYCIDLALLPLLLFRSREWLWTVSLTSVAFLLFVLIEVGVFIPEPSRLVEMNPYTSLLLAFGAFIGAIAPSVLLFWQSNASFRQALRRNRMLARDEKFSAIGRVAAGGAHEINNPLAIIQLTLENLEGTCEGLKDRAIQYRIKKGYEAIYRIHQILQKLLASTLTPLAPPESFLVRDLAQAIDQRCSRFTHMHGIGFRIRAELREDCRIICHRKSIIEVVDSLINNAFEAMNGQGKACIGVTLKCEHLNFLVQVEDTGPGISEEKLRSIFTPFFTTKAVGAGLGLSLYSARCIAQQYGGDLSCDLGPGGRFYLSLPLQQNRQVCQALS